PPPPRAPSPRLFPYTTPFRSRLEHHAAERVLPAEELELRERDAGQAHGPAREVDQVRHQDRRDDPHDERHDREVVTAQPQRGHADRKSTRLNSSHVKISYAVF